MQIPPNALRALACLALPAACADDGGSSTAATGAATTASTSMSGPDSSGEPTPTSSVAATTSGCTAGTCGSDPVTTDPVASTGGSTGSSTSGGTSSGASTGATTGAADTTAGQTSAADSSGGSSEAGSETGTTGAPVCPEGQVVCEGATAKVCDGLGGFKSEADCPAVCVEGKGCLACVPGEGMCAGEVAQICTEDGMGTKAVVCDAVQGMSCDPEVGKCVGACAPDSLGLSYLGCDYYPTVTSTGVVNAFEFAVVVANASGATAKLRIERGAQTITDTTIAAGSVKVVKLPWVAELKGLKTTPSQLLADGAYHLRTDQPVTVYQYNPLDYKKGDLFSSVNDASLLLPVNTWSGDYWIVARDTFYYATGKESYPGFYAVTAGVDGTTVTLAPGATGKKVRAGGGVAVDGTGVIAMNQGDVLQVMSGDAPNNDGAPDVTGTHVTADRPIQVIGGHFCTYIPPDKGYCDHLEEALLPFEALGRDYITTPALIPGGGNLPKPHMVRIVATTDGTTLSYDPQPPGAPAAIAKAGEWVEIAKTGLDFRITANHKIVVAQYMQGQTAGGNTGDPAMAIAVPVDQFRANYLFHSPLNYEKNYVNIVAPTGVAVTLDGAPVGGFVAVGGTGYSVARPLLANNADGNHAITAPEPISISVYGYGQYTSYWYPGGLDLHLIPQ